MAERNRLLSENDLGFSPEETYLQSLSPTEALKFNRLLQNKRVYSPEEASANRQQTLMDILYSTPVISNALSVRDATESKELANRLLAAGDQEGAKRANAQAAVSAFGAILPFNPFGGMGKNAALTAGSRTNIFAGPMAKTADRAALERAQQSTPMDEAARMERAATMGYADQPFYRGEATGKLPGEYESGFFSRDPEYARGFAVKGGQSEPREFRLNLSRSFSDTSPLTASQYANLVESAAKTDPKLAADLAEMIAPGKGAEWVIGFGKAKPDFVVVEQGGAPLVRQAIERGSSDPVGLFKGAGYDAIDSGRDVRKLGGEGIRLKDAAFDPSKAASKDILAALSGVSPLPTWPLLMQSLTSRQD